MIKYLDQLQAGIEPPAQVLIDQVDELARLAGACKLGDADAVEHFSTALSAAKTVDLAALRSVCSAVVIGDERGVTEEEFYSILHTIARGAQIYLNERRH